MYFLRVWAFVVSVAIVSLALTGTIILFTDFLINKINEFVKSEYNFILKMLVYFILGTFSISMVLFLFTYVIGGAKWYFVKENRKNKRHFMLEDISCPIGC